MTRRSIASINLGSTAEQAGERSEAESTGAGRFQPKGKGSSREGSARDNLIEFYADLIRLRRITRQFRSGGHDGLPTSLSFTDGQVSANAGRPASIASTFARNLGLSLDSNPSAKRALHVCGGNEKPAGCRLFMYARPVGCALTAGPNVQLRLGHDAGALPLTNL
jgi:hypothetical protein